jgi:hypothetical protein
LPCPEPPQPLPGLDHTEVARLLVPFPRDLRIGLQTDDLEPWEFVGNGGARLRHCALRQSRFGRALKKLTRGVNVDALKLCLAVGVEVRVRRD